MKAHDYMALVNVIEGAGGKITDKYGKPITLKSDGSLIASSSVNLHNEIIGFIKNIEETYPHLNFIKKHNTTKHQTSNSECGMYSIYFILTMLDAAFHENNNYTPIYFFDIFVT